MQSEQVKLGFSRLGIIIGACFLVIGAMSCASAIFLLVREGWSEQAGIYLLGAAGSVVMAGASYAACWALAWIITGFMRN